MLKARNPVHNSQEPCLIILAAKPGSAEIYLGIGFVHGMNQIRLLVAHGNGMHHGPRLQAAHGNHREFTPHRHLEGHAVPRLNPHIL